MLHQKEKIYLKYILTASQNIENLIVGGYLLYVPYPILDVIKGFLICDVIDEHDTL